MTKRFGMLSRGLALALTAGVVLSLAGCGNEGNTGPGYASKDNVVEAEDANAPLTRDQFMPATYQASVKAGSAHMTMRMTGPAAMSAQGDVSYVAGGSEMQMTVSMPQMRNRKMEMRFVDQMVYMQIPGLTPAGKFVAIDPKDQSSPLGKSFAGLSDQMDPMSSVKAMTGAVTSLERVGQGSIKGTSMDHYRVSVDAAKVLKKTGQPVPASMPTSITYDMWLDEDNLMRRMTFALSGTSFDSEFSKWGEPVKIARPAASELVKQPTA
jgi:lipoprotein LprG